MSMRFDFSTYLFGMPDDRIPEEEVVSSLLFWELFSLLPLDHLFGVSHQGAAVLSQQSSAEIHEV